MSYYWYRTTGMENVIRKVRALPVKLQKSITNKAMTKAGKVAVQAIRTEIGTGSVLDTLKVLVQPNRKARAKAKTDKGRIGVAARLSQQELRRSIGVRKFPRSRMRNKGIVFHAVGPRAGFKITNIRSFSKRIPYAASTVAKMVEQGTMLSKPNAFTRRVLQTVQSPYQQAMLATARDLIAKASA